MPIFLFRELQLHASRDLPSLRDIHGEMALDQWWGLVEGGDIQVEQSCAIEAVQQFVGVLQNNSSPVRSRYWYMECSPEQSKIEGCRRIARAFVVAQTPSVILSPVWGYIH